MSLVNKVATAGPQQMVAPAKKPRRARLLFQVPPSKAKPKEVPVGHRYSFLIPREEWLIKQYEKRMKAFEIQDRLEEAQLKGEAEEVYRKGVAALTEKRQAFSASLLPDARSASPSSPATVPRKRNFSFGTSALEILPPDSPENIAPRSPLPFSSSHDVKQAFDQKLMDDLQKKKEVLSARIGRIQTRLAHFSLQILNLTKAIKDKAKGLEKEKAEMSKPCQSFSADLGITIDVESLLNGMKEESIKLLTEELEALKKKKEEEVVKHNLRRAEYDKGLALLERVKKQIDNFQTICLQRALVKTTDEAYQFKEDHDRQTEEALLELRAKQKERNARCAAELERALGTIASSPTVTT